MNQLSIVAPLPHGIRGNDGWGAGHFGASRTRTRAGVVEHYFHTGADFISKFIGENTRAPISGVVDRYGVVYAESHYPVGWTGPRFRLIVIVNEVYSCRLLYMDPAVAVGSEVNAGDVVGVTQGIELLDPGITGHVHCDLALRRGVLIGKNGEQPQGTVYIDPAMVEDS